MSVEQYSLVAHDWLNLEFIINDLASRVIGQELAPGSSPTWVGATLTGLTASRLIASDTNKALISSDLYSWVAQTANQVLVADDGDGTITLSLPQDYDTGATPTLGGLTLSGLTETRVLFAGASGVISDDAGLTYTSATDILTAGTYNAIDEDNVLQIDGTTVLRTGTAGNNNIFFGIDSFSNINEGTFNVGIGFEAGYNNSIATGGGVQNVCIGYRAGKGWSGGNTGMGNVAIGYTALESNQTGSNNFALGTNALASNTTGFANVAIGPAALSECTGGFSNIGIGSIAFQRATNSSENTVIGYAAARGTFGHTVHNNVMIGAGIATAWTNGADNNTIIGRRAGNRITSGSDNVFIGYHAGYWQTTGSDLFIIDNQDRSSIAAELTDCLIYGIFSATPASQSLRFNVGTTTWHNATHEDSDGGRKSQLNFKGQQSGGEETTLARIEISHDGTGDDEKGKIVISTNDGDDSDTPTAHIKVDAAGNTYIGDGGITNYSKFEADGTLEFNGAATVWKDINLGSALLTKPAASAPDTDEFKDEGGNDTGIETYAFAPGEKVSGNFELQHDYKEGSDIIFHVHFQGIAAPSGTDKVKWQLIYTVTREGATLDATTTIVKEIDFDTQYEFLRADFIAITGTNYLIEDQFLFQLSRISASVDEYSGDALIATAGLHYEIDTIGSRAITTK